MRNIHQGQFTDLSGNAVASGSVTVYLAGTTILASVYATLTSATAVNSVTSDSAGKYIFYTDIADYDSDQTFKIVLSKSGFLSRTYDDIKPTPVLGTYTISANTTYTTHIEVPKGVVFSVDNGITLTFSGTFEAGLYQTFSGLGTVIFERGSGLKSLNPMWYGAKGDMATDDTSAFLQAIGTSRATYGTTDNFLPLDVPAGVYYITSTLDVTGVGIRGAGVAGYGTCFRIKNDVTFTGSYLFIINGTTILGGGASYQDFLMYGDKNSASPVGGIKLNHFVLDNLFTNIRMGNFSGDAIIFTGPNSTYVPTNTTMINVNASNDFKANGLTMESGEKSTFIGCVFEGIDYNGVNITSAVTPVKWATFINTHLEQTGLIGGVGGFYAHDAKYLQLTNLLSESYGHNGGTNHGIYFDNVINSTITAPETGSPAAGSVNSYALKIEGGRRNRVYQAPLGLDYPETSDTGNTFFGSSYELQGSSKGQIFTTNQAEILAGTTTYLSPYSGWADTSWDHIAMTVVGYLHTLELRVNSEVAPGGADTYTITVVKTGVDTDITMTLTGAAKYDYDLAHEVSFIPGNLLCFKVVTSATATTIPAGRLRINLGYTL